MWKCSERLQIRVFFQMQSSWTSNFGIAKEAKLSVPIVYTIINDTLCAFRENSQDVKLDESEHTTGNAIEPHGKDNMS